MQRPPHHESIDFRRHFKFKAQLILVHMSSRDTSTERRLLTRLLDHEEQDSVLEQALPQDAQAAQAEPQDADELPRSRTLSVRCAALRVGSGVRAW